MSRRPDRLLRIAIALIVVGMVGVAISAASLLWMLPAETSFRTEGRFDRRGFEESREYSSLGEQIYFTGVGNAGLIETDRDSGWRSGMMGRDRRSVRVGCAYCHGADGRGRRMGMMGRFETPDIRYDTLIGEHEGSREEWSERDIERAIRDGIEPDGSRLRPMMPRWQMDDTDMSAIIDYLKELD